ncbi:GNAT family N-acetyltransferase [Paracoccaceae bacterium]|nr:GNAT family N-acetyltransferase [Paracoccaceae bacterium]
MIKLKRIDASEIEAIRYWRNSQLNILRQKNVISAEEQLKYFKLKVWPEDKKDNPKQTLRAIYVGESFVGYGGLTNISWEHKRAEISFLLDPEISDNQQNFEKYFNAFLRSVTELAFVNYNLQRVYGETYAFRTAVIKILENNGFVREGRLRNNIAFGDNFIDSILHGKLRDDDN